MVYSPKKVIIFHPLSLSLLSSHPTYDAIKKIKQLINYSLSTQECDLTMQNLFLQDEWQTTVTKKGKKSAPTNNTESMNNKPESLDMFDENDQKPNNTRNISRGGGTSSFKGML